MNKSVFVKILPILCLTFLFFTCDQGNFQDYEPNSGEGGSFARFTIVGNYLYSVDNNSLHIYNISQASTPVLEGTVDIGEGIETIFPHQHYLFIGANSGMYIYDISEPNNPSNRITFEHATACDPVVANDSLAFITLRGGINGSDCNQMLVVDPGLYIVDIKDINNPSLINYMSLQTAFGLGYDGNTLFVCNGTDGLYVYDYSNPTDLQELAHISDFTTFDVIPLDGILLVVGPEEFRQYDYTNLSNLSLISTIKYAL